MMVVSAVSGLNVALPDLARATGASQTQLTWIVDAYTVVFAGLLLAAGALGDRYGRKGILVAGLARLRRAAALGDSRRRPRDADRARVLMGVGAAAVMPTTLSVITTSFPPEERGRAVSVWVGIAGGGAVIGLFGSGILLEFFSWNSFFALNVTLAVLALVGTLAVVPTSRDARPGRLDVPGALLSLVGVASLVFAIIEGADRGWGSAATLAAAASALVAARRRSCCGSCAPRRRCWTCGCSGCAASAPAPLSVTGAVLRRLRLLLRRPAVPAVRRRPRAAAGRARPAAAAVRAAPERPAGAAAGRPLRHQPGRRRRPAARSPPGSP